MGRLAFAVLLLSLELVGRASASNADGGLEGKASLVSGVALPSQLGSGVSNASTCLSGNSTWGSCGSSRPAGITYATTAQNWTQTLTAPLNGCTTGIGCATQVISLPAGISGIDVTTGLYDVYILDGSNSEAVAVIGGTYIAAIGGTITFVPYYNHTSYTVQSASSGIQETINVACGTNTTSWKNKQCNVTIPANGGPDVPGYNPTSDHPLNNYQIYGTIYFHAAQSALQGSGVSLNCFGRGPCLQVGDLSNANHYNDIMVEGIHFRPPVTSTGDPAYAGVNVTHTVRSSRIVTVTTTSAHGFRPGDMVTILFTDNSAYWGDAVIASVPTAKTFTYAHSGSDIASQATPGVVALAYVAVLDNANGTHFSNVSEDGYYGETRYFNNFFDIWDDENCLIEHFSNNAIPLNNNANWTGSYVFSSATSLHPVAPVITLRDSGITANWSNGVTVYNSNGLYIENTVIQAQGLWQVYASNTTGNYQGAYLKNIYAESSTAMNPQSPAHSPFPGLGNAGLIAGSGSGAATFQIAGNHGVEGGIQGGGTGSAPYYYYIVAHDASGNVSQTSPMLVLAWHSTGSDSIPVRWPRIANGTDTITYDVIRSNGMNPYGGGCPGGSGGTCGSVATGLSQATACSGTLVCTYTDSGSSTTSAYGVAPGNYIYGNYNGQINFWPGAIVSVNKTITVDTEQYGMGIGLNGNPLENAKICGVYGEASPGGFTSCLSSITSPSIGNQTATLLTDGPTGGGASMTFSKGRLNFPIQGGVKPHHIITLIDSQPQVTEATGGYRPLANANDTWIGTDVSSAGVGLNLGQLAFGSPVAISNYIGKVGDNTSWLERLTSKQKTFAVPVRISEGSSFTLGDGSPLSKMKIYSVNNMAASRVPPQSCVDVVGEAKGVTKSDKITSITPPGRLGDLSLNAYPADEGAIILHFCNPSKSEVITPPGAYSFLAVR